MKFHREATETEFESPASPAVRAALRRRHLRSQTEFGNEEQMVPLQISCFVPIRIIRVIRGEWKFENRRKAQVVSSGKLISVAVVGVSQILDEIKSLPPEQRWEVLERTREMLGPEIPESFKQGMREIARGETIELDEALGALDPAP
jgi:hypothetical protein